MKIAERVLGISIILIAGLASGSAETLEEVKGGATADLERALAELSDTRNEIADERLPMSRAINVLKQETRELRREVERGQRAEDSRSISLEALEAKTQAMREENEYIGGLMAEFFQSLQAQMTASETQRFEERVAEVKGAMDNPDVSRDALFVAQLDGIRLGNRSSK